MKNARKFTAGAALAAVMVAGFGLPAMAGGMATPIVEPTIAPAAPVVMQRGGDWTGGYVGAQLGYGDVSAYGAAAPYAAALVLVAAVPAFLLSDARRGRPDEVPS